MTNGTNKQEQAMERWCDLAYRNCTTDYKVNDLLERIAGDKYLDSDHSDDPIWETIQSLNDNELAEFLDGCDDIDLDEEEE